MLGSCSCERFLPQGQTVLSKVKVSSPEANFRASAYRNNVYQEPNARWFNLFKVPLGIYSLSKADSVKGSRGFSRILRSIGEAPVVYDMRLTAHSVQNMEQMMQSKGYLHALVDTLVIHKRHKTQVEYVLHPGPRYYIDNFRCEFDDSLIYQVFQQDSTATLLRKGMPLDLNLLSEERSRIIQAMRERGYYAIHNDYIRFDIDTLPSTLATDVTLHFRIPAGADSLRAYTPQFFRNIRLYEDAFPADAKLDSTHYRGLTIYSYPKLFQKRRLYSSHVSLMPDSLYKESDIQHTYSNLNALPPISFTTLKITPIHGAPQYMDCDIYLRRSQPHSIGAEIEGTNTSGDLGAAVALTYTNRNLFRGAEQLSLKLRGAYEAITGLEGYNNQNYIEWSGEIGVRFPTLLLPFVTLQKRRELRATSEAQFMYDSQDRPEFHRRVLTGTWSYRWNNADNTKWQHRYDLFSLNYVYMPWISDTFRRDYLEGDDPHYAVLRYSYENLFIMKTGYSFIYNSLRGISAQPTELYQTNGFQVKFGFELAGNLLYGLSKITKGQRDANNNYSLFGIAYSQYAKIDFDFAQSVTLGEKNSFAFHLAFGLGIPYGNSNILPYEKRYFAGGANSVRGWSVRELGPGSYKGKDGKVNFVNQTGDVKLDLSVEWRTYLFWKLHGAFFIDAGNIWTTHTYADMEEGKFKFNTFYKQIAVAYGLGLRLNFDYFIIRLDGGMKAIDPAVPSGRLHYPITKPNLSRDLTIHFAVGLPF